MAEELSTTRRVRLHARIAETLEELYGDAHGAHAAELAHHFAEAEAIVGPDKLVHYSLLAGEKALGARAYEEALIHVERGLIAKGVALTGTDPAQDAEAAALLSCLGEAQRGALTTFGHLGVIGTLTRAFDYYVSVGDVGRAVGIAAYRIPINTGRELIERALKMVPPDSHDAGRLLSCYIPSLRSEYDRAQDAIHGALAIARQQQDLELEMQTLVAAACVDFSHCGFEKSLDRNLQAIVLARQVDLPSEEAHARQHLMHVQYALGDLEDAARHAEASLESAERSGTRVWQVNAMDANHNVCSARGDWQAARYFNERGLALTPRDPNLLGGRALVEYQVGDFAAGETYLQRLLEAQPRQADLQLEFSLISAWMVPILVIPLLARITRVTDRFDMVESTAQAIISSPGLYSSAPQAARIGLALIAVQRGDGWAAQHLYDALEPLRGTIFPQYIAPGVVTDGVLGLLAQTVGELDIAIDHFDDALSFCRKAGYRPELAWTCCDYADTLKERDATGDRSRAITLLDESLAISSELGMRPLMERVLARKLELQGVASVDIRTSIDAVASAVTIERPDLRPHTAPDGTVTILFSDIEGFTQMTERLGDQRMQQVLQGHNDIVRHQVAAYGGFEVKSLRDGFMLAFSSARRALQCSISIQRAFAAHNQEHPEEPVRVRIGLHTGEFVQEMEDFFGKNVILASRIADQAQGGEILVSSLLKELTDSGGDIRFGEMREVELKGLAGINRVHSVEWQ